jgi:PqqD family protein of HPr-rel-A system
MSGAWRLAEQQSLSLKEWDGDIVVYNDASGDTHLIEGVAAAVFDILVDAPASDEHLVKQIAAVSGEPREAIERAVGEAINGLRLKGVIELLP